MKRLGSALLSTVLLSSVVAGAGSAAAADNIKVVINGVTQSYTQQPVLNHNATLVPFRAIFESLGAQVSYDEANHKITATKGPDTLEFQMNSTTAYKNGQSIALSIPAKTINGSTYVPLRFVGESLGAKVNWDGAASTVKIETEQTTQTASAGQGSLNPLETAVTSTYATYETNTEPLAYKDAVALAVSNSNSIKSQEATLKAQNNSLEDAADDIDFIPPRNGTNDAANSAFNNYSQQQINYSISQKKLETEKDGAGLQVKNKYNAIIDAIEKKRIADLNVADAEWKLRIAQTKRDNQMASDYDVTQAQNTLAQQKAAQEVAAKALDDAYRSLNAIIGYKADQKYEVLDIPKFEVFKDDVEAHVGRVQADSPTVWMAERGIEQAELDINYFNFVGSTDNAYENKEINVDLKKISSADAKKQLEDAVRQTYNQIKELETQYTQLQASMTSAQSALDMTKKRFELGMSTEYEVFQAELQLESLKQQMTTIVTNLDNAKTAYEKPWLVAGQQG
ncbi:stalk domain-containing protein [Paenibacillus sp. P96]|uniref:Stalk domain-containing protein n=1 Tax=Paenibacillus zeirhizosphaerae TaxID=2987519 RepID=A0ABT9FMV1_9BACL|nr:stalk domain-containing protein [Paenibacillus sp. P96]MDP4096068.1 stalk domain-containing protein [Paenibacillus sp. P96]